MKVDLAGFEMVDDVAGRRDVGTLAGDPRQERRQHADGGWIILPILVFRADLPATERVTSAGICRIQTCSSRLDRYVSFTTKVGGATLDSNGAEGGARPPFDLPIDVPRRTGDRLKMKV